MSSPFLALARFLHRSPILRRLARLAAAGLTLTQPFHRGLICLNAVEHSWAWTGGRKLEDFDRHVQDRLIELMQTREHLIDVGCNVGVMTLSVLLHHSHASAIAIDPNQLAIQLLNRSLRRNRLTSRAQTFNMAVSDGASTVGYDSTGSFTGHVAGTGKEVQAISLLELVNEHVSDRSVIKVDIEGYEALLAPSLRRLPVLPGSTLVIEVHPLGFNGMGDPQSVLSALHSIEGAIVCRVGGGGVAELDPDAFHQIEVAWPDE